MRIAIIVPRYGSELGAGAETQARGFAEEAARRGWTIEVWTTCARDHYTWENELPAGVEWVNGVLVRRFPITGWDPGRRAELETALMARGKLRVEEQYAWMANGPISTRLFAHIARNAASFDAVVALPYLMSISYYGAWAAPGHVILWPCLHDEVYAYMEPIRLLMESVWGVMFNSPEEGELAVERLGISPQRWAVLGEGVTLEGGAGGEGNREGGAGSSPKDALRAREGDHEGRPNENGQPYLLYVGRLEEGKNLRLLYDYVARYTETDGGMRLVTIGTGPYVPPAGAAFEHRGYVSDEEKGVACAGALALCQPSLNESFSRVVMESWLAGRPVLVHRDCDVTRGHVQRAKGGLAFRSYPEFAGAVEWLRANPVLAGRMGANGCAYVQKNYTWEAVTNRFERIVREWKSCTNSRTQ